MTEKNRFLSNYFDSITCQKLIIQKSDNRDKSNDRVMTLFKMCNCVICESEFSFKKSTNSTKFTKFWLKKTGGIKIRNLFYSFDSNQSKSIAVLRKLGTPNFEIILRGNNTDYQYWGRIDTSLNAKFESHQKCVINSWDFGYLQRWVLQWICKKYFTQLPVSTCTISNS